MKYGLVAFVVVVFLPAAVFGQEFRGTISGAITDSAGAANPTMLGQLAIGVIATGNPSLVHPFDNGAAAAWSIGGTPSQTSEILLDGSPNATWDNRLAYSPPQDAVREVRVKAFDADAAYGHTGSGTINKVMKTGTNQIHGSAYEFGQPSGRATNNFFNNRNGLGNPATKINQ